jgi:hypothetical protein
VRRTYYLMQMPGWRRRLRIMVDWAFALVSRPDIVKISVDSEAASPLGRAVAKGVFGNSVEVESAQNGSRADRGQDVNNSGIQLGNAHRDDATQAGSHPVIGGGS